MLSIRDSLEWCLRKSLALGSVFLQRPISFLRSETNSNDSPSEIGDSQWDFEEYFSRLSDAVHKHGFPSPEATSALNALRAFSPVPHVEATPEGVWDIPTISIRTHMKSTLADAVMNIESIGWKLSSEDIDYLRLLLTHECGWSATSPERMNDHWMSFFKTSYPHVTGLVPILDTMTYPEEFKYLPDGRIPPRANFFLLATPESYYVYDCSSTPADAGYGLNRVGKTLKDVYIGMKEWKYCGNLGWNDPWEVEDEKVELDYREYFPIYDCDKDGMYRKYGRRIVC